MLGGGTRGAGEQEPGGGTRVWGPNAREAADPVAYPRELSVWAQQSDLHLNPTS